VVIIGYDPSTVEIIKTSLNEKEISYCIVLTSQNPIAVRQNALTSLTDDIEKRLYVYHGGRDSKEELLTLYLKDARSIYILGEPTDSERESLNLQCFKIIRDILSAKAKGNTTIKNCFVQFENYREYQIAQNFDLTDEEKELIDFKPINVYEEWSRRILSDLNMCMLGYNSSSGNRFIPIPAEEIGIHGSKYLHLFIIGFEEMGRVFATHAARTLHFPNLSTTKITIIDPEVHDQFNLFSSQFPGYKDMYDIQFNLLAEDIFSTNARTFIENTVQDQNTVPYIMICLKDSEHALTVGMSLPLAVYKTRTPVTIRYSQHKGISELIRPNLSTKNKTTKNAQYDSVRFWGINDAPYFDEKGLALRERFSISAHNAYLKQQNSKSQNEININAKDEYQRLKSTYKWANRYFADSFQITLRSVGLTIIEKTTPYDQSQYEKVTEFDNNMLENLAKTEHARWIAERVMNGWVYGEKRDNTFKIHPMITPWENLDYETRDYDFGLIKNMILALNEAGFMVVKK